MAKAAATVSVGGVPAAGVVRVNRRPQRLPSPALPPVEATQAARMLARVLSWAVGAVAALGSAEPGAAPVAVLASLLTEAKARAIPWRLEAGVPRSANPVMKGASAKTLATVVTSLTVTKLLVVRFAQSPTPAISAALALAPAPALPP